MDRDVQEVWPRRLTRHVTRAEGDTPSAKLFEQGEDVMAEMARLHPSTRAAARGWSDLTIRNVFIFPTLLFLIIFNVFPLIYSLGYSFTDFRLNSQVGVNLCILKTKKPIAMTSPAINFGYFTIGRRKVATQLRFTCHKRRLSILSKSALILSQRGHRMARLYSFKK